MDIYTLHEPLQKDVLQSFQSLTSQ